MLKKRMCRRIYQSFASGLFFILCFLLVVLVQSACLNQAIGEKSELQPQAHHQMGASVFVEGIETDKDWVILDLQIINGSREKIRVADTHYPIVLQDEAGRQYKSANELIELDPYTLNTLRVRFSGPLSGSPKRLSLKINAERVNHSTAPQLVVNNIPTPASGRIMFAHSVPGGTSLPDMTFHHPIGLTLTLREINFTDHEIKVTFFAVNGYKEPITLIRHNSDPPFVKDEEGHRYYLVPALSNQDLSIPAREKLSGRLHFAGQISSSAHRLSLHFNDKYGGDKDYSTDPKVIISGIPVVR